MTQRKRKKRGRGGGGARHTKTQVRWRTRNGSEETLVRDGGGCSAKATTKKNTQQKGGNKRGKMQRARTRRETVTLHPTKPKSSPGTADGANKTEGGERCKHERDSLGGRGRGGGRSQRSSNPLLETSEGREGVVPLPSTTQRKPKTSRRRARVEHVSFVC